MPRINIKTGEIIEKMELKGKNPEKQLQAYCEKYLKELFNFYLLKRYHKIPGGEIDTLAITYDGNPVIIEYKRKKDETILNQITYYYDWLQKKSTKYEIEAIVRENNKTKNLKVDWSGIRLICIAKEYSKWDISLIQHLDTNIECYTYTYHKDELDIHLDPIISRYTKTKYAPKRLGIKEATLESHMKKADEENKNLLRRLREKIFGLGDNVEEGYTPEYIKYYVNSTFVATHVRKKWLILHLRVNEKTFKDPKGIAKDISKFGWSVTRQIKVSSKDDLEYLMPLIKQAYEYQ